jgi:hypothetical protein
VDKKRMASETIFNTKDVVIPMEDVQHIDKRLGFIITKHTKWNFDHDIWENAIWLNKKDLEKFLVEWCFYRSEIDNVKQGPG